MSDPIRLWYVAPQRLCNWRCDYCVSIGTYAKSNAVEWSTQQERDSFHRVVGWIGTREFAISVRLATVGEPFASAEFLRAAAWLTQRANVEFVELLTNGSLLRRRLPRFARIADLQKISLWITYHPTQTNLESFVTNARCAQEEHGIFVVVNALLFPENGAEVEALRRAAGEAGLRFNLDFGYDPRAPSSEVQRAVDVIPVLRQSDGVEAAVSAGARRELVELNLKAIDEPFGRLCGAGHGYFYIGIEGDVYRCSRYYVLKKQRLGNVLEPGFDLMPSDRKWERCGARGGCCNKEDFLNLKIAGRQAPTDAPSLGWSDGIAGESRIGPNERGKMRMSERR